ncbi:hypothetical protein GW17_00051776 [Ensete ventricosum]|nr:hypothetical protein GW17_00051776 [Ensete ventricosum]
MNVLIPIVPLYGVSLRVDGSDVHHGSLRGSVITEVVFRTQKPSRHVFVFPSGKVHQHVLSVVEAGKDFWKGRFRVVVGGSN